MKRWWTSWAGRTEALCLASGALCAGILFCVEMQSARARHVADSFGKVYAAPQQNVGPIRVDSAAVSSKASEVVGRLEIRQLALSVPIMSDYESDSLLKGVGHIPGTAMPGGLGTLGLAGHRDTYFRPLRGIRKNMDIRVADKSGVYHYQVDSTEIVTPDQVEVLAIGSQPSLTLITCYPFYYVGSAPQRFIVHAHLVSAIPD